MATGVLAMAVMLALSILGMRAVGRFLEPSDPRRAIAIKAVLWIGTGVLVAILLLLRE
jgi:hypothetical protein